MKLITKIEVAKALVELDLKKGREVDRPMDVILAIREQINLGRKDGIYGEIAGLAGYNSTEELEKSKSLPLRILEYLEDKSGGETASDVTVGLGLGDVSQVSEMLRGLCRIAKVNRVKIIKRGKVAYLYAHAKYELPESNLVTSDDLIFGYLDEHGVATAKDIIEATRLPKTTVSTRITVKVKEGLLQVVGKRGVYNLYRMASAGSVAA